MLFDRLFRTRSISRHPAPAPTSQTCKHTSRTGRRRSKQATLANRLEALEPRQLLAFTYQGITHTCVGPHPQQQNYQYNFKIFQQSPTDTATTMYLRDVANTGSL